MSSMNWDDQKYRGVVNSNAHLKHQIDLENRVFFDMTAVAPPPSRDYFHLKVTFDEVVWTHWEITHGSRSHPHAVRVDLDKLSQNAIISTHIAEVFGQSYLDYILGLSKGRVDWINILPDKILTKIISYVGLENLFSVAPVCIRFQKICESDPLWKNFYRQIAGIDEDTATQALQATYFSWKNLFLANRIQDIYFKGKHFRFGTKLSEAAIRLQLKEIKLVN